MHTGVLFDSGYLILRRIVSIICDKRSYFGLGSMIFLEFVRSARDVLYLVLPMWVVCSPLLATVIVGAAHCCDARM